MLAVSSTAAAQIIAARDRRDFKVLGLLCVFCGSILTATGGAPASYRLAVASLLGLVMVIGGRVTPALTCAFLGIDGTWFASYRGEASNPGTDRNGLNYDYASQLIAALASIFALTQRTTIFLVRVFALQRVLTAPMAVRLPGYGSGLTCKDSHRRRPPLPEPESDGRAEHE